MTIVPPLHEADRQRQQAQAAADAHQARYAAARAVFDARCRNAGETIHRTVAGVEGVLLLDLRAEYKSEDFALTCPALTTWQQRFPTRFFTDRVLQPAQGD